MSEVTVVARARAKPGKEAELEAALRACITPTHQEAGCVKYTLHRGADDASAFTIIERWTSREMLNAHMGLAHVATLFATLPALVADQPVITVYNPLAAGDINKGRL